MEIDKRREIIDLGNGARHLLQDETLAYAFHAVMNEQFMAFAASYASDEKEREKIWANTQAIKLIKDKLEALVASGRVEEENKKHDES